MSKKNKKQEEVNQWFNVQQTCCVSCMHRNLCVYLLVCAGARACRCVTAECVRTSPPPPLSGWAAKEEDPRTRSQPITALGRCRLYRRRGSPETRSSPCLPLRKVRDVKNWHVHGHIYSKKSHMHYSGWPTLWPLTFTCRRQEERPGQGQAWDLLPLWLWAHHPCGVWCRHWRVHCTYPTITLCNVLDHICAILQAKIWVAAGIRKSLIIINNSFKLLTYKIAKTQRNGWTFGEIRFFSFLQRLRWQDL